MIEVGQFKMQQDSADAEQQEAIKAIKPFLAEFLRVLEQFTNDALKSGLRDVKPPKRSRDDEKFLEVTLAINGLDLTFGTGFDLLEADANNATHWSRLLIYLGTDGDHTPFMDIIFYKGQDKTHKYVMRVFTNKGITPLGPERTLKKDEGLHAAGSLLNYLYGLHRVWIQNPTLADFRAGRTTKPPLGFRTPSPDDS